MTRWTAADAGSSNSSTATAAASTDPLYRARRTLHTGADLLTDRQRARLDSLFAGDAHVEVETTWAVYQNMITAYREPDRATAGS